MRRVYITGNFEKDLEQTIKFAKDKNINEFARMELTDDFCSVYVNYDSSKFDKYFI